MVKITFLAQTNCNEYLFKYSTEENEEDILNFLKEYGEIESVKNLLTRTRRSIGILKAKYNGVVQIEQKGTWEKYGSHPAELDTSDEERKFIDKKRIFFYINPTEVADFRLETLFEEFHQYGTLEYIFTTKCNTSENYLCFVRYLREEDAKAACIKCSNFKCMPAIDRKIKQGEAHDVVTHEACGLKMATYLKKKSKLHLINLSIIQSSRYHEKTMLHQIP